MRMLFRSRLLACFGIPLFSLCPSATAEVLNLKCTIEKMTDGLKLDEVIETNFASRFFSIDLESGTYWTFYKSGDFDFENRPNRMVSFDESLIVLQDTQANLESLSIFSSEEISRLDGKYELFVGHFEGAALTLSRTQHGSCEVISPAEFPKREDRKF